MLSDPYNVKVSYLLRQHASGCYPIHPGYLHSQRRGEGSLQPWGQSQNRGEGSAVVVESEEGSEEVNQQGSLTHHQFTVQVEGVRALEVAANTVWGEADCFIQYHFPTLSEGDDPSQIGESVTGWLAVPVPLSLSHPHHPPLLTVSCDFLFPDLCLAPRYMSNSS